MSVQSGSDFLSDSDPWSNCFFLLGWCVGLGFKLLPLPHWSDFFFLWDDDPTGPIFFFFWDDDPTGLIFFLGRGDGWSFFLVIRSADYAAILPIECRLENNPHHPPRLCDRCWYLGFAAARLLMEKLWTQLAITRACAYFSGSKGVHVEAYPDNDGFVEHFDEITKNPSTLCPNRARYSVCQRLMYRDFPDEKSSHMVATCPTNQTQTGLCVDRKWMERLFEEKCVSENAMLEPRTADATIFSERTVWTGIVNGIFGLLPQHFKAARGRLAAIVGGRRNFKGSDRVARWRRFVEWCDQTGTLNELKTENERTALHILWMPRKVFFFCGCCCGSAWPVLILGCAGHRLLFGASSGRQGLCHLASPEVSVHPKPEDGTVEDPV